MDRLHVGIGLGSEKGEQLVVHRPFILAASAVPGRPKSREERDRRLLAQREPRVAVLAAFKLGRFGKSIPCYQAWVLGLKMTLPVVEPAMSDVGGTLVALGRARHP